MVRRMCNESKVEDFLEKTETVEMFLPQEEQLKLTARSQNLFESNRI